MTLARRLHDWFRKNQRDLPWRRTKDPYAIWLSEIMLQQTRVTAVIPYYERFLARFPTYEELAAASESELLAMWSGLGYYSRARNLQKAAILMVEMGGFPSTYEEIRELPGVGDYTAAAVASIAFGLPRVGLDGNIVRVMARWTAESGDVKTFTIRTRLQQVAQNQMDTKYPGIYKQALMELGATICLPKAPKCLYCPINDDCVARLQGLQNTIPIKIENTTRISEERTVLWIRKGEELLVWQRPPESKRLAGFWELPEPETLTQAKLFEQLGEFSHSIVNHKYRIILREAKLRGGAGDLCQWVRLDQLKDLPISTVLRKSLRLLKLDPRQQRNEGVS
ncbi:MAG: A/G-specific adenine glycosylase [Acidobacteria bacterium]|nr:A/G-specific adenine glycosylase [Acidobacteriota bacterium]